MSLIEKAIDRLHEPKRARTAEGPGDPGVAQRESIPGHEIDTSTADVARAAPPAVDFPNASLPATPGPQAAIHQTRRVGLNLEKMRASGLLTPDAVQRDTAEEYRHIKRPLLKNAAGQGVTPIERGNLIMVTSARPSEGKTFTAMNLAVSIAMELDKTVLLVDADLARPSVIKFLDGEASLPGLVDYLLDKKLRLSELLLKTDIPKLSILPAGRSHPNATELLASQNMQKLTKELSERYQDRIIIFDSPPLLATSQASVLAAYTGQILVVVEAYKTSQAILKEALSLLDPGKVVGLILNKGRRFLGGEEYGYYGYYHYGTPGPKAS